MNEEIDRLKARIAELETDLAVANEVIILMGDAIKSIPSHPECVDDY